MDATTLQRLQRIVTKPHGIFLVTGPTGSGKTTTLYASLAELNADTINILTVEDPIEYNLPGIGQTQVNARADMTFARGLRAILRQDPDVVLVGEIRDLETSEVAIQASLTGHLVMSTLHTNSAVGAVTRLVDMASSRFFSRRVWWECFRNDWYGYCVPSVRWFTLPMPRRGNFLVRARTRLFTNRTVATRVHIRAIKAVRASMNWSLSTTICAS